MSGPRSQYRSEEKGHKPQAVTLASQAHRANRGGRGCTLCDESHALIMCDKFKSLNVNERRAMVLKQKRCFACLRPNHNSRDCKDMITCGVNGCNARHSRWLHLSNDGSEHRLLRASTTKSTAEGMKKEA